MPNPNPGYIDQIKAGILQTQLGKLVEQFTVTGNLSVSIAFSNPVEFEPGHAQLPLENRD